MSDSKQLSIFEHQFDSRIHRIEIEGTVYFSVTDIFKHYGSEGSAQNPAKYWARIQKRIAQQGGDIPGVVYRPTENGGRPTPFIDHPTFWRAVQASELKEWEPLRKWMAGLANERIEEAANPDLILPRAMQRQIEAWKDKGKSDAWIKQRLAGKQSRNVMTAAAQDTHITNTPQYGALTAREYQELLGMSKSEIVNALHLSAKEADTFRDHLNTLALRALDSAEAGAALWMESLGRPLTDDEQMDIVMQSARDLAPGFHALAGRIGIKLATGQRLIGPGRKP